MIIMMMLMMWMMMMCCGAYPTSINMRAFAFDLESLIAQFMLTAYSAGRPSRHTHNVLTLPIPRLSVRI
jgi:hypothetical protein